MQRLGYEPHVVESEDDRIDFTEELIEEYTAENKRLIDKVNSDLAIENPDDLNRRKIQASVLEKTITEHYDEEFVKQSIVDIEDALDLLANPETDKGFLVKSSTARFDFKQWPLDASMVGFMVSACCCFGA